MLRVVLAGLFCVSLSAWGQPAATGAAADSPSRQARTIREPTPAQAAQRQRMRDCNAEARRRNLSGADRSAFMRPCLGGNAPTAGVSN